MHATYGAACTVCAWPSLSMTEFAHCVGVRWADLVGTVQAFNKAGALYAPGGAWYIQPSDIDRLVPSVMTSDGAVNFYIDLLRIYYTPTSADNLHAPFYISDSHVFSTNFDWTKGAASKQQLKCMQRVLAKKYPDMLDALFWVLPIFSGCHFSLIIVVHPGARREVSAGGEVTFHPPVVYHIDSMRGGHPSSSIFKWVHSTLAMHNKSVNKLAKQLLDMDPALQDLTAARSEAINSITGCVRDGLVRFLLWLGW